MINGKDKISVIAVTTLLLLMPRVGHMSQSFLEFTSLENLVNGSDIIMVVSKMNPDITTDEVPFDSNGRFPPFHMRRFHFQGIEILYDKFGLPNIESSIDVVDAGEEARYENEKKTLLKEQPPVSPVYFAYKLSVPYEKLSGQFIAFLRYQDDHLTLTTKSAFELIKKKKQVLRLVRKLPPAPPVVPSPDIADQSKPSPLLNVTIKLERCKVVIGDSIPIEVTLENSGKTIIEVPEPAIGSEFQFILMSRNDPGKEYYFSRERAINERYPLETPAPHTDFSGLQLAPGATQVYNENLGEYIVNAPPLGDYTLEVGYKEERSNGIVITIINPGISK
jgi:hypothetical protein